MNYGEGITWIIVFKCSIQFVEGVERKMEFPIYQQVEPSHLPPSGHSYPLDGDEAD